MREMAEQRDAFLRSVGWENASVKPLAGDASSRSYKRLSKGPERAVLMVVPDDARDTIAPFLKIGNHLRECGLHAPEILAADPDAGFVLLEDLGDDLLARRAERLPEEAEALYHAAVDVIFRLQTVPAPHLPQLNSAALAELVTLVGIWYAGDEAVGEAIAATLAPALRPLGQTRCVMSLRDYHAENILILKGETGLWRIGLLDFQDAVITHPAYDIVSLLQDARRDIDPTLTEQVRTHAQQGLRIHPDDFNAAFYLLGLQRALRILGVFGRLSAQSGKTSYVDLIPRVWAHLEHNLSRIEDAKLTSLIQTSLPAPDAAHLTRLRSPCPATHAQ